MDGMSTLRNRVETHPIAGSLGAVVTGVDLSRPMDAHTLAELRTALLDHLVIFFRDQALTPATQLAFARHWGDIHLHPFMTGMPDQPEVLEIRKTPKPQNPKTPTPFLIIIKL